MKEKILVIFLLFGLPMLGSLLINITAEIITMDVIMKFVYIAMIVSFIKFLKGDY